MDALGSRLKKAVASAASAASAAASAASAAARDLGAALGATNALRHWRADLDGPADSVAGPWSLYAGIPRSGAGPPVSVWVLSKAALGGGDPGAVAAARRAVTTLARLRHPSLLRVVGPLEETKDKLVFVSEAVALTGEDVMAGAAAGGAGGPPPLSAVEVKAGVLALADALCFLHSVAGLVHRSVGPAALAITAKGQWKLCGLGLALPLGGGAAAVPESPPSTTTATAAAALPPAPPTFDWLARGPAAAVCRPDAAYSAPEVVSGGVGGAPGGAGPPADVFSLAVLTADLLCPSSPALAGRVSGGDPAGHAAAVAALTGTPAALARGGLPPDAAAALRPALAPAPGARPLLSAWTASPWFAADAAVSTLRALDAASATGAGAEPAATTAALLMDVAAHMGAFDARTRTLRLLPPLLAAAAADPALQAQALPLILTIVSDQAPSDFASTTLPALRPVCAAAAGAGLAALARALPALAAKCPSPADVSALLLPIAARALDGGGVGAPADAITDPAVKAAAAVPADPRAQEDALKAAGVLALKGGAAVEAALLPRAHAAALRTTSGPVRAAALGALGDLCARAPKAAAVGALDTLRRVATVDGSPSTTASALALGRRLAAQWGPDLAAGAVLPALCPLLASRALPDAGFQAVLGEVRSLLAGVERARRARGGRDGGGGGAPSAGAGDGVAAAPPPVPPPAPAQPTAAAVADLFAGMAPPTVAPAPAAAPQPRPPPPRPPPRPVPVLPPPPSARPAPAEALDLLGGGSAKPGPTTVPDSFAGLFATDACPPPAGRAPAAALAAPTPPAGMGAAPMRAHPTPPPPRQQPDSLI